MSIDRDQIALDVLLALLRQDGDRTITPESIGTLCQVAYAFADGLLSESVRPAEGEEVDASFKVIDTVEGPRFDPNVDTVEEYNRRCEELDTVAEPESGTSPGRGMTVLLHPDDIETATFQKGARACREDVTKAEPKPAIDTESNAARTRWIKAQAQKVYKAYPRKDNKVKAIESIVNALTGTSKVKPWPFDDLLRRVRQYAEENPPIPRSHPDYNTKHPLSSTWINQRRFEDEHFDEGAAEDVSGNPFLASLQDSDG